MGRSSIRFTLALVGSLGLHAGLWWWQPIQPPRSAVSDHSMFQVSLLQPASSAVAPAAQAAVRQETPPTEAKPPVAEMPSTDSESVADIADVAPLPAVDASSADQEPPEPSESVAESSAPVQPSPTAAKPPVTAPEPVTPPTREPRPARTAARTESNPTPTPNRPPTAATRPSAPQDSAERNIADSARTASTSAPAGPEVVPARVLDNPRPAYPRQARRRGLEGQVVLEVQVLPDGHPGQIEVVAGSGHSILDRAALAALRDWRFEPAREGGRAVSATLRVPVHFQLR